MDITRHPGHFLNLFILFIYHIITHLICVQPAHLGLDDVIVMSCHSPQVSLHPAVGDSTVCIETNKAEILLIIVVAQIQN